jgi:quinol monooxygenase YgiN
MNARIAVIGIVRFPPERVAEIRPYIKSLVAATHGHDGCIAYDVAEDLFDPGLLRFSELWPDAESLARHAAAPHIAPWHAAAKACGQMEKRFHIIDVAAVKTV